jgi:hypothetical protein
MSRTSPETGSGPAGASPDIAVDAVNPAAISMAQQRARFHSIV